MLGGQLFPTECLKVLFTYSFFLSGGSVRYRKKLPAINGAKVIYMKIPSHDQSKYACNSKRLYGNFWEKEEIYLTTPLQYLVTFKVNALLFSLSCIMLGILASY